MRMQVGIERLLALLLIYVAGGRVAAQENPLRVIADTDTLVPGSTTSTFQNFFQLNGVDPDIDGRNVVFAACCPTGIYVYHGFSGQIETIADLNSTFPDSGNPLGFDVADGSGPSISGSNVAFSCRNGRPGPGAICAYINGQLESIAESGATIAPFTNETFGTFFMLNGASPDISGENVVFTASTQSRNGIYARINGQLIRIADNTTPVPGQLGLTFLNFGQLGGTSPSISGENVAFLGVWSTDSGVTGSGVYAYINGDLIVIAATGMPAPEGAGNFGPNFGQSKGVHTSISGENVVFVVGSAVYGYLNGSLKVIVDRHTPAPGTTGTFGGFLRSPVVSAENIVFAAGTDIGAGIFAYINGQIELIANRQTPIPGHENTTFEGFDLLDRADGTGEGVRPSISGKNVVFFGEATMPLEHSVDGIYSRFVEPPIPAVSTWLLVVLAILVVTGAITILHVRCRVRTLQVLNERPSQRVPKLKENRR